MVRGFTHFVPKADIQKLDEINQQTISVYINMYSR